MKLRILSKYTTTNDNSVPLVLNDHGILQLLEEVGEGVSLFSTNDFHKKSRFGQLTKTAFKYFIELSASRI